MSEISCLKFDKSWANEHFQRHNFREISPDYLLKNPSLKNEYETVFDPKTEYQKIDFDSKRGRKVEYAHSIKEAVLLLKDGTRLSDIKETVSHIEQTLNIKCCSIAIHNDEGHIEDNKTVYNTHAHLVFYTLDKDGKQNFRLTKIRPKLSALQREIADKLGMKRPETGSKRRGLTANQFRQVAKEKAVLTQKIEVKNQELQKLQQEQALQVFKANLNHFQEGENSHDNYNFEHFSHDQYSHSEFKNAVNRTPTDCVCVPRLSECGLASDGQSPDLSLHVATSEGVYRHQLGNADPVLSLLSKTSFTTESGAITTLKQLSQLKSEIRKAFIAEQRHTQEDYKALNQAIETLKKRFKNGDQLTTEGVVQHVLHYLDQAKELKQENEELKTELQEKPKEVEVPRELTSEEIEELQIVQALREQHEKDKQNVAQASRRADEYRKQLNDAKSALTADEIENLPRVLELKAELEKKPKEIVKEVPRELTEDEIEQLPVVKALRSACATLETRMTKMLNKAKSAFIDFIENFSLKGKELSFFERAELNEKSLTEIADKAYETVATTIQELDERLEQHEERTQHRSFHR